MEWAEVVNNPTLKDLPFKIELNKFGKILMSPASNQHGRIQARMAANLINKLPLGEVITKCSILTSEGVKVANVVPEGKCGNRAISAIIRLRQGLNYQR